eukprot:EC793515.1.p4 GENE.EC793515.1~~EC793515.1.p4  ORF type:complete len:73 (-),score=11.13 EC793515.1:333-551(-)
MQQHIVRVNNHCCRVLDHHYPHNPRNSDYHQPSRIVRVVWGGVESDEWQTGTVGSHETAQEDRMDKSTNTRE